MIDLELAREHLKADEEDVEDDLIEQYIASAAHPHSAPASVEPIDQ